MNNRNKPTQLITQQKNFNCLKTRKGWTQPKRNETIVWFRYFLEFETKENKRLTSLGYFKNLRPEIKGSNLVLFSQIWEQKLATLLLECRLFLRLWDQKGIILEFEIRQEWTHCLFFFFLTTVSRIWLPQRSEPFCFTFGYFDKF